MDLIVEEVEYHQYKTSPYWKHGKYKICLLQQFIAKVLWNVDSSILLWHSCAWYFILYLNLLKNDATISQQKASSNYYISSISSSIWMFSNKICLRFDSNVIKCFLKVIFGTLMFEYIFILGESDLHFIHALSIINFNFCVFIN